MNKVSEDLWNAACSISELDKGVCSLLKEAPQANKLFSDFLEPKAIKEAEHRLGGHWMCYTREKAFGTFRTQERRFMALLFTREIALDLEKN